jgi:predicted metalloprotease with PDZ domain
LLWFSEGITCYYESVILERAGAETFQEHLDFLAGYIKDTENTEGRKHMSMRQSSYDIWLNFFNRSANSSETTISYYVKGPVIGFLMDLQIQTISVGTKSLDDLMNLLYWRYYKEKGRGFTEEEFWAAAEEVAGGSLEQIRRYVDTTEEIDYDSILEPAGFHLDKESWTLTASRN